MTILFSVGDAAWTIAWMKKPLISYISSALGTLILYGSNSCAFFTKFTHGAVRRVRTSCHVCLHLRHVTSIISALRVSFRKSHNKDEYLLQLRTFFSPFHYCAFLSLACEGKMRRSVTLIKSTFNYD